MLNLRTTALAASVALAAAFPVSAGDDGNLPVQALYDQVTAGEIDAAVGAVHRALEAVGGRKNTGVD